jgi:hypothetical protein
MLKIEIETDNAAFAVGRPNEECARILRAIAEKLEHGRDAGNCIDANGNKVGTWEVKP